MLRLLKHYREYKDLSTGTVDEMFVAEPVSSAEALTAAKRLHASIYLQKQYIAPHMVNRSGVFKKKHDPYQVHADYFVVRRRSDDLVVAAARQIRYVMDKSHKSFPLLAHLKLYVSRASLATDLPLENCLEISGLVKQRGITPMAIMLLYREMWRRSLQRGDRYWLMACDRRLYKRLSLLFGKTIKQIGPVTHYLGSPVVPALLNLSKSKEMLMAETKSRNFLKRALKRKVVNFLMKDG